VLRSSSAEASRQHHWKGIEATQKLAESSNSKIVVIGGGKTGLGDHGPGLRYCIAINLLGAIAALGCKAHAPESAPLAAITEPASA
jgi:hypothetical protein